MTTSAQPVTRVALVITELEVGGAERCLVQLACGLDRQRYAVKVYALASRPKNERLVEQLEGHHVPIHFLEARGLLSFPRILKQLRIHIARQQPQIIQAFLFHSNVVVSYLPRGPSRIFFGVRVADPRSWRSKLERWRARRAVGIVCVSNTVRDYLIRRNFPAEKLAVIPNGVDARMFESESEMSLKHFGIADENAVILFLGRLDPQKGIDWLLKAVQPVLAERPNCHLVLAGSGDWPHYQRFLHKKTNQITWLGWQANTAALLRRSSVLVLPSRWEGMPNVVLEAMAARVPVLATDVEGVRETLGPATEQQIVRFDDSDSFQRKLRALLDDVDLRAQIIVANQARVKSQFTIERMVSAYERLWKPSE
jgi:glycosyltransferase involved in cell wall biosynthesis